MGALRNGRQEVFAQEIARGASQAAAYVDAGYQDNRKNASRMRTYEVVNQRIEEIQADRSKRLALSRDDILEMILDDRREAKEFHQFATAVRVSELVGRELHSMFTDKKQIEINDISGKSLEELESWALSLAKPEPAEDELSPPLPVSGVLVE